MQGVLKVKDIMTSGWIATLHPDDNLIHAAKLFGEYNYDGFPVIQKDKTLVGILTGYDMVSDSIYIHLSGLEEILEKKNKDRKEERSELEEHFKKIGSVTVKEVMNSDPLTVTPEMGINNLAKEFIKHHRVNPIPVVDGENKLLGVVSRYDLIKFLDFKYLEKVLVLGSETI